MRIVVTGATGFIGRPLVRRLLRDGHEVLGLTRDARRAEQRLPARCELAEWDRQGRVEPAVLDGRDAVVHLAGEGVADGRWTPARKREILASRVARTRALVDALAALPPERRPPVLVAASAIGWYGDRADEVLDEASSAGEGFLVDVCREWEAEARRAESLGVRLVTVRIGIVLGTEGGALARLLPLFRLGVAGRVGSGRQWMSWIHLDDMVEMLCFALAEGSVRGVVNGVAPHPRTNADFTRALARALGRPALLPAPAAALKAAMGEMATVVLASQRVEPRVALAHGFVFRFPEIETALAQLCAGDEAVILREQWFPQPPEEIFPFFADAFNLEQITPAFLAFRVLRTSTPVVGEGTLIDYRLRLHGIPVRWRSRIEEWRPGERFVDCQVRGPYRLWHHTHEFEPCDGGTLVRDRVRYRLPLGALGQVFGGALVRRDLDAIFDFRYARLRELFGGRPERSRT